MTDSDREMPGWDPTVKEDRVSVSDQKEVEVPESETRVADEGGSPLKKSLSTGKLRDYSSMDGEESGHGSVVPVLESLSLLQQQGDDVPGTSRGLQSTKSLQSAPTTGRNVGFLSGRDGATRMIQSARVDVVTQSFDADSNDSVRQGELQSNILEHANTCVTPLMESDVSAHAREDTQDMTPGVSLDVSKPKEEEHTFKGFLSGEFIPEPVYHTTDVVWGQTERDRVYNALLYVPYHLERLLGFGNAVCLNAFLGIFTVLPLRVLTSLFLLYRLLLSRVGICSPPSTGTHQGKHDSPKKVSKSMLLRGDQIFDLICVTIFVIMILFLWHVRAGAIYFWVKELTQEFLKLSVLHTALELGDKICCSFGVDLLEALAASCTSLSMKPNLKNYLHVASDASVALLLLLAHAGVLMSQALVYGVAMNCKRNTLLALLIASNFTELKGTVFKRFDPTKLSILTNQDIVERFHLYIILSFVLVEECTGLGQPLPSTRLLRHCFYVMVAEIVIDVTKHAVLGKFNDIRPGVYEEFTKDLCENLVTSQSHTVHKLVGIEPFASAALFFRVLISFTVLQQEILLGSASADDAPWYARMLSISILTATFIFMWIIAAVGTLVSGYLIRIIARRFLHRYNRRRKESKKRHVTIMKKAQTPQMKKKHV